MISIFRVLAWIEGISFLLILFVTMPLKYLMNMPDPNKIIGMSHGVLFLLYIGMCVIFRMEGKWNTKVFLWGLLASILPFGTFWFERKYISY